MTGCDFLVFSMRLVSVEHFLLGVIELLHSGILTLGLIEFPLRQLWSGKYQKGGQLYPKVSLSMLSGYNFDRFFAVILTNKN